MSVAPLSRLQPHAARRCACDLVQDHRRGRVVFMVSRNEPSSRSSVPGDGDPFAERDLLDLVVTTPGHGVTVVALDGDLDMASAPRFVACVQDLLQAAPRHVVIDLSAVAFMGSHGVAALFQLARAAPAAGTSLWVTGVTGNRGVERICTMTGVAAALPVRSTTAELLESLLRGPEGRQ